MEEKTIYAAGQFGAMWCVVKISVDTREVEQIATTYKEEEAREICKAMRATEDPPS